MLGPLVPLAFGALFAGLLFHHLFIGGGMESFWGESLFYGAANHVIEDSENAPWFVGQLPLLMLSSASPSPTTSTSRGPARPSAGPTPTSRSTGSCSTSGTSTSSTTCSSCARPSGSAGCSGTAATRRSSTASAPTASRARCWSTTDRVVKFQTGFVYHYAFVMMMGLALIITYFLVGGFR